MLVPFCRFRHRTGGWSLTAIPERRRGRAAQEIGSQWSQYGSTELHLLLREPGGVAERLFDVFALQVRVAREHLIETWLNAAPVASSLPRSFGNAGRRSARGALESAGAPPNASSEPGSPGRRRAARALGAPPRTYGTSGLPSVSSEEHTSEL